MFCTEDIFLYKKIELVHRNTSIQNERDTRNFGTSGGVMVCKLD